MTTWKVLLLTSAMSAVGQGFSAGVMKSMNPCSTSWLSWREGAPTVVNGWVAAARTCLPTPAELSADVCTKDFDKKSLVIAHNKTQQFATRVLESMQCRAHLALTRSGDKWQWDDGSEMSYQNWVGGMPSLAGYGDCVAMRTDGKWERHDCNALMDCVLCFDSHVRDMHVNEDFSTYRMSTSFPRKLAADMCESRRQVLAVIPSQAANARAILSRTECPGSLSWIGASDPQLKGTFVWDNGEPVKYDHWHSEESPNKDCAALRKDGFWQDLPCLSALECVTCSRRFSLTLRNSPGTGWSGMLEFHVLLDNELLHYEEVDLGRVQTQDDKLFLPVKGLDKTDKVLSLRLNMRPGNSLFLDDANVFDSLTQEHLLFSNQFPKFLLGNTCGYGFYKIPSTSNEYAQCYDAPFTFYGGHKRGQYKVGIHSCNIHGAEAPMRFLSFVITGQNEAGVQWSTKSYSLGSDTFDKGVWNYFYVSTDKPMFYKLLSVTVMINEGDNPFCFDDVTVNGEHIKSISHNWIITSDKTTSRCGAGECPRMSLAVFNLHVCAMEIIAVRPKLDTSNKEPGINSTVTGLSCLNNDRLATQTCEVSQSQSFESSVSDTYEFTEESSESKSFTTERGTEVTHSGGGSFTYTVKQVGSEQEWSGWYEYASAVTKSESQGKEWTKGESTTNSDSMTTTTTKEIMCSASIEVAPSRKIPYTLTFTREKREIETETDLKLTLCTTLGAPAPDLDNVVYIFDQPGRARVEQVTSCAVHFMEAHVLPNRMTCTEEQSLSMTNGASFVPRCQKQEPALYEACQCHDIDTLTAAVCMCVDSKGNPKEDGSMRAVEDGRETWQSVCEDLSC